MNKNVKQKLQRGIVLIDKQPGRTSHDEVAILRGAMRSIGVKTKVGHSGTLDPKVTGLLVMGLGKGTKVLEYMLLSQKQYIGEIIFHDYIDKKQLDDAIDHFRGVISQLPPRKSSVKREEREREIYDIQVKDFDYERKKLRFFARSNAAHTSENYFMT